MKINSKIIDDVANKISHSLPSGIKSIASEFESSCKSILKASFEKLDLVTREEFDIQKEVLLKTRQKLEQLEKKIDELLAQHDGK
ncbi:accessory factor UbiK family protein [Fastidiosibacter lacustris]|uniref:accessory factor UbiK family protein n=1 Tax=Fastidiosibacter lacustris TaxID=2056695 RepID=UPI000E34692E|nr:accessory factor UbiK family protein [Fastidiosibacter lacustris]